MWCMCLLLLVLLLGGWGGVQMARTCSCHIAVAVVVYVLRCIYLLYPALLCAVLRLPHFTWYYKNYYIGLICAPCCTIPCYSVILILIQYYFDNFQKLPSNFPNNIPSISTSNALPNSLPQASQEYPNKFRTIPDTSQLFPWSLPTAFPSLPAISKHVMLGTPMSKGMQYICEIRKQKKRKVWHTAVHIKKSMIQQPPSPAPPGTLSSSSALARQTHPAKANCCLN